MTVRKLVPLDEFECGELFCGNPACKVGLHVHVGTPGVDGAGNWAVLPEGIVVGRGRYGEVYICDLCGRARLQSAG